MHGEEEMMAKVATRTAREYSFRRNRDQFMVNIGTADKLESHSNAAMMLQLTVIMAYMYLKDGFDLHTKFLCKGFLTLQYLITMSMCVFHYDMGNHITTSV